jgi:hypothetical protein
MTLCPDDLRLTLGKYEDGVVDFACAFRDAYNEKYHPQGPKPLLAYARDRILDLLTDSGAPPEEVRCEFAAMWNKVFKLEEK